MKKWLIGIGLLLIAAAGTLYFLGRRYASRIEPYLRDQAVVYLRERFQAEVKIGDLKIEMPGFSPVQMYLSKGKGHKAAVGLRDVELRMAGFGEPVLRFDSARFEAELDGVFGEQKRVSRVTVEGMEIVVPPRGERPGVPAGKGESQKVGIGEVAITRAKLTILPRDRKKTPLEFDLRKVTLRDDGAGAGMAYEAEFLNPRPPGEVKATGRFGPWVAGDPAETAISGDYTFSKADLGVFAGIAGILESKGSFRGKVAEVDAEGEASVPDFRLKMAGNRVPLFVKFAVRVDGTNGDTILKPVQARLGETRFTTSGGIIRHDGDARRTIDLNVDMPGGRLEDVLRLAVKGSERFMSGTLTLRSKVAIPPLAGKVIEKLRLNGTFEISDGKFLQSTLQERLDQMSRQAQGQPKNEAIDEVLSRMSGRFRMENESITFESLQFSIPGADLALAGKYSLDTERLDFRGDLRLRARLSETQTGWKKWALKPVDPFFAKQGAGTFVKVKIEGPRANPKFGRDKN